MIAAKLGRACSTCVPSVTLSPVALRLAPVCLLCQTLGHQLLKLGTPCRVIIGLLAIAPERTRARLDHQVEQVLVVNGEEGRMQEDLDDADQEAHAAGLVSLVAWLLALLGVSIGGLVFDFDELRPILLQLCPLLLTASCQLCGLRAACSCTGREYLADVGRDQDHVQVGEAAQLEELLAPLIPLLDLYIAQHLVVDADERVEDLERVEHLVGRIGIDD